MTERSLRILIAALFVFGVFIYGLSLQVNQMLPVKSPDEGKLGGPISGLTRWQLNKFEEGKALFAKKMTVSDGLGPLFNAYSCAECHGGSGITGGASPDPLCSYTKFARRKPESKFAKETAPAVAAKVEESDLDYMLNQGGPILLRRSISEIKPAILPPGCTLEGMKLPKEAEFHSNLLAPALYGLGFVNSTDDVLLNYQVFKQYKDPSGPHGKQVRLNSKLFQAVGRFGSKCQESSLFEMLAGELGTQIGISHPLFRKSVSSKGFDQLPVCVKTVCPADPNNNGLLLNKLNFYLNVLAPPQRGEITAEVKQGEQLFERLGCAVCHLPSLQTATKVFVVDPDGPPIQTQELTSDGGTFTQYSEPRMIELRAMERKTFQPYSDFLVHDLGTPLADGIAGVGTTGGEWRTTPLWGLRFRNAYMHDGRASKLQDAIKLHGGQAANSLKAYNKLTEPEKNQLVAFLKSL